MFRVAVLGAGGSGLASIKACLEEGFQPVCYEKSSHIGGLWHFSDEPRPNPRGRPMVYEGMCTNLVKEMMGYTDFPMKNTLPPYVKHSEMLNYYHEYARHFDLLKHIQFNTEVVCVGRTEDYSHTGRWNVTVRNTAGEEKNEVFDGVMVCTGMYSAGHLPQYPGMEMFEGQILHSSQFKKGLDFQDKTVLVVGASYSAGDIASVCSLFAKQVYISLRDGAWIIPLMINRHDWSIGFNERWKKFLPGWMLDYFFDRSLKPFYDTTSLGIHSSKSALQVHPMINSELPGRIMKGQVIVRSGINYFEGPDVICNDGAVIKNVDCVIFATGYDTTYPFIEKESIPGILENFNAHELYMHIFPPQLAHPTLGFVGCIIPSTSSGNFLGDMQARFIVKHFQKETKLPEIKRMMDHIDARKRMVIASFGDLTPYVLDPTQYYDEIAAAIGALPSFLQLVRDPELAFHYFFRPAYPACYRLVGPGANPKAREQFLQCGKNITYGITLETVRKDAHEKLSRQNNQKPFKVGVLLALIVALVVFVAFFY